MEDSLKKLEASEAKYATELDRALKQYAELKEQAKEFDPVELYKARRDIRPAQEKTAEERQVRQMLIRRQRSDPQKPKHFQR